jgi:hypothetical protein
MDADHECQWTLCFRMIKSGLKSYKTYVNQCVVCGGSSTAIAHDSLSYTQKHTATEFDEGLRKRWHEDAEARRQAAAVERQAEFERGRIERQEFYNDYINSPEWRALSRRKIRQAGGICEGCGERPATQSHHLTYKHLGCEFLWELKAVCEACHKRVHGIDQSLDRTG